MSYQAVFYDYPNKTYYLRDEREGWVDFKYHRKLYKLDPEGKYTTLFGDKCSQITGKVDWNDKTLLERDIDSELLILRDLYYKNDEPPSFHNILYLDIEIELLSELTPETIRNASAEITSISLIDVKTKQKYCFILDQKQEIENIDDNEKIIVSCGSERELLLKFLDKWEEIDPTIVVGWNSDYFDIPYLYFRIKQILGNGVYRLSPIKKIIDNPRIPDSPIRIGGVNCLDFMLLFKKYMMKEEPSYKLGDIGKKYVDLGKIEYEGSLNNLYKTDKQKFIEYNLRDVEIIEKLEDKLKFIQLTVLICHLCHTPYESIYYNTILNDGAILTYLKRKGIIPPNKPTTINPSIKEISVGDEVVHQRGEPAIDGIVLEIKIDNILVQTSSGAHIWRYIKTIRKKEGYAGGYLKVPVPGLYEDITDFDFTSLYPSIIKSLNLGVETLVGRIVTKDNYEQNLTLEKLRLKNPNEIINIQKLNHQKYELEDAQIEIGKLIQMIEKNNWSISASGAIFKTNIKSIACEVLEDWFNKREEYRGLKKKAGKAQQWVEYNSYDLYQMAFKILQNALYGGYAINSWRFTDGFKICSAAITNSGQRLDQFAINHCNNFIQNELKTNKDYVVAADTDSVYVEVKDLLNSRYPRVNSKEEKEQYILEIASELQKDLNDNLSKACIEYFNIKENKYFQLKQEVIVSRAYWAGKRRYAMWVTNKEGVPIPMDHKDSLDIKGLDIMKSNMTPIYRNFGKEILIDILHGVPKQTIDKKIIDFRKSLKKLSYQDIAKPTGVKKIREYIAAKPSPCTIFSKLENKCPINTKASIFYNDLLRFKGVNEKYKCFMEGDKMFFIKLKDNPYNIDVLGFRGGNEDPQFIKDFLTEYADMDEGFESIFLNKIQGIFKDIGWNFPSLNENVTKFFKFV